MYFCAIRFTFPSLHHQNGTHSGAVLAGRKEVVERNAVFAVVRASLAALFFGAIFPCPSARRSFAEGTPLGVSAISTSFPPPNGTHSGAVLAAREEVVERNALFAVVCSNLAALIFWNASPTLPTRRCLASSRQTSPHAMRLPPYCDTASLPLLFPKSSAILFGSPVPIGFGNLYPLPVTQKAIPLLF